MAGLQELRERAKALRIPGSLIRANMNDAEKLESLIEGFEKGKAHVKKITGGTKMARKAKPVARAKAKAKVERPSVRKPHKRAKSTPVAEQPKRGRGRPRKTEVVETKKRGRPKGSGKSVVKRVAKKASDAGRNILGKINYSHDDGWNPREGSTTYIIFKALKKFKGDREKAFTALKPQIKELIPLTKPNGQKRTKEEREDMLRYRIARCDWDFAMQTGQHEKSENRVEYGSRTNGTKSKSKAKKGVAKATGKKRGRPKGSTKAVAVKGKRGRGRPKGSKNKVKAGRK